MPYTPNEDKDFEDAIRGKREQPQLTQVEGAKREQPQPIEVEEEKRELSDLDFAPIAKIFNSPEYRQRQEAARQKEYLEEQRANAKRPSDRKNIRMINQRALQRKLKLQKTLATIAITIAAVGCLVTFIVTTTKDNEEPVSLTTPSGYVQMMIEVDSDNLNSVHELATEYYDQDLYGDLDYFVQTIINANGLSKYGSIGDKDTITIPVFVDVDNPCYQELKRIEAEMKKIKEEAYWVDYTVQYGDTISGLAAKASGSYGETIGLVNDIMRRNNFTNSLIYDGQKIQIINPALGPLKIQFKEMQAALIESLAVGNNQK